MKINEYICCINCHSTLNLKGNFLQCSDCKQEYPIVNGTPVMLLDIHAYDYLKIKDEADSEPISKHEYAPRSLELIEQYKDGLVLDLGAGGKDTRYQNVIQLDIFNFKNVDVVASGDNLPFADNTFDAVISQAVFEHLKYPEVVSQEIYRVLKPGGKVKIDTAFLQPLHAYPHHYYNASLAGLKQWFFDYEILWEGVEEYQKPWIMLHDIFLTYFNNLPNNAIHEINTLSIKEFMTEFQLVLNGEVDPQKSKIKGLFEINSNAVESLAAGVSIIAQKQEGMIANDSKENSESEGRLNFYQRQNVYKSSLIERYQLEIKQKDEFINSLLEKTEKQNTVIEHIQWLSNYTIMDKIESLLRRFWYKIKA